MKLDTHLFDCAYLDNHIIHIPFGFNFMTIDKDGTVKAHKAKPIVSLGGYWGSDDACVIGTARCSYEEMERNSKHYYHKRIINTTALLVPNHHRYVARDDDGDIWSFSEEPKLLAGKWQPAEGADFVEYITDEFINEPQLKEIPGDEA